MDLLKPFRKAVPDRNATDAPVQPQILYLSSGVGVAIVNWSDRIAAAAAMHHPIVHRALDKIAQSVQQVRFLCVQDPFASATEARGNATKQAKIQSLLDNPNDQMPVSQFRYWMGLTYATYGRVPLRITMGAIDPTVANALYPLDAGYVYAKGNKRGGIDRYEYGLGNEAETFPSQETFKRAAQDGKSTARGFVTQFWKPGLKGYQSKDDGNAPLQSLGLPAQVIRSLLLRAIATAEGHPNVRYMVTCSKTLTDPQKEALKKFINDDHRTGGAEAGSIPILQNAADIEIHKLDNDLSDIHSKMPSDDMARLIFGGFGIPIALAGMGAADAAKFASNYVESRSAFWEDTIVPGYISPIAAGLTSALCPPGLVIQPDLDSVPAMMAARLTQMKELKDVAFLTTTEKRELFGYAPTTAIPESGVAAKPSSAPTPTDPNSTGAN